MISIMNIIPGIRDSLLRPLQALRWRYVPLLMIYFAYGLQGFSAIALSFWTKEELLLSAEQLIAVSVWILMPWTLKIVFGQMVDTVKIFGNRRQSYIYLGAVLMMLGSVMLAGLAGEKTWIMWLGNEYVIYLLSSLFATFGFVIQDVTADTMTTEVVERRRLVDGKWQLRPEKELWHDFAMVQILGRLSLLTAALSVAWLGGHLAQIWSYEVIFWLTLLIPVISLLGTVFLRLEKTPPTTKPLRSDRVIMTWGVSFMLFSVAIGAVSSIEWQFATSWLSSIYNFIGAYAQELSFVGSAVLLGVLFKRITRSINRDKYRSLFLGLLVLFIYRATPSVGPGFQWWMIDVLQFDPQFFGVLNQLGLIFTLLVLWLGAEFIASRPLRSIVLFLIVAETVMALPDLSLYYGLHEILGVEARTVALFDTAIGSPLGQVTMVPVLALIAFYAPKNNRGTWFAVGASIMNLALAAGSLQTKYLNQFFTVTREITDEAGQIITAADYSSVGIMLVLVVTVSLVIPLVATLYLLRTKKTPKSAN